MWATVKVLKTDRTTTVIFDRPGRSGKEELRIAFVVAPKAPYLVTGRRKANTPTIRNRRHITENFTILVADIQCGLLMDGAGTVLGAYPTN